jgi:hypothetical protein
MSMVNFKIIFCVIITLFFFGIIKAQFISIADYDNKAQAYAILSAQYTKLAYLQARKMEINSNPEAYCDTGRVSNLIAIEYADSALYFAHDSSKKAIEIMQRAISYQHNANKFFNHFSSKKRLFDQKSLVFALGNAIDDAYLASLLFDNQENEEDIIAENKERLITRIETDEFSFVTIKEIYGNRLTELTNEINALEKQKSTKTGDELVIIENTIKQLKEEEKKLKEKIATSSDKLLTIQSELSEEMLKIVDEAIFTTEKTGFYNEQVPIPKNPKMPEGLVFRIQIGFFRRELPEEHFDGIFPLASEQIDNTYFRYIAGNFPTYEAAKRSLQKINDKGYSDAFIVAYFNRKKISISEALSK